MPCLSNGKFQFTDAEIEYILKLYINEKKSISFISSLYKVNYSVIRRILKENNIVIRDLNFYKKLEIDSNFFNEINTEEKAYVLGFLYADGCVSNQVVSIKQKTCDEDILIKIKEVLKSKHKIIHYIENSGYSNNCKVSMLSFKDIQIYKDLQKHGVIENKSKILKFPKTIPENLICHFIRGYFDGDGSVYYVSQSKTLGISFIGTFDFLNGILICFQDICNTKTHIIQCKNKNIYELHFGGKNIINAIYNYMYKDATIYLNRKFEKFSKKVSKIT